MDGPATDSAGTTTVITCCSNYDRTIYKQGDQVLAIVCRVCGMNWQQVLIHPDLGPITQERQIQTLTPLEQLEKTALEARLAYLVASLENQEQEVLRAEENLRQKRVWALENPEAHIDDADDHNDSILDYATADLGIAWKAWEETARELRNAKRALADFGEQGKISRTPGIMPRKE